MVGTNDFCRQLACFNLSSSLLKEYFKDWNVSACVHTHACMCIFGRDAILLPAAFSCRRESACPCSDCLEEEKSLFRGYEHYVCFMGKDNGKSSLVLWLT